jgi:hypothetical protein
MEKSKSGMFLSTKTKTPQTITISEMIITLKIPSYNLNKRPAQEPLRFSEEEPQEHLSNGAVINKNKQYAREDGYYGVSEPPFRLCVSHVSGIIEPCFR